MIFLREQTRCWTLLLLQLWGMRIEYLINCYVSGMSIWRIFSLKKK
jgi:hypothetical protein